MKKLVTWTLACCMTAGVLAACGNGGGETTKSGETAASSTEAKAESKEEKEPEGEQIEHEDLSSKLWKFFPEISADRYGR